MTVQLGAANREHGTSQNNVVNFLVEQILAGVATVKLVEVMAVAGSGG